MPAGGFVAQLTKKCSRSRNGRFWTASSPQSPSRISVLVRRAEFRHCTVPGICWTVVLRGVTRRGDRSCVSQFQAKPQVWNAADGALDSLALFGSRESGYKRKKSGRGDPGVVGDWKDASPAEEKRWFTYRPFSGTARPHELRGSKGERRQNPICQRIGLAGMEMRSTGWHRKRSHGFVPHSVARMPASPRAGRAR
jgi:hypothetical protein